MGFVMGLRLRRTANRRGFWTASEQGSAAIEFAFVAPIFFALMLGIMEIGVMTFGQFALQNAVTDAGRLIRTGQAQSIDATKATPTCAKASGSTPTIYGTQQSWFTGQVCCGVTPLMTCSNLVVTVTSATSGFSSSGFNALGAAGSYSPGAACDVVLVRANYIWTIWFPGLAQLLNSNNSANYLVDTGSNGHMLAGTAAFRNEPFTSGVSGC
jgi:Flp pilus assembly protein TadG